MLCDLYSGFEPSQLSCLGSLVGKSVAWRTDGRGFESHARQPIFLWKMTVSGELCCVALPFCCLLLLLPCLSQHLFVWLFMTCWLASAGDAVVYTSSCSPSLSQVKSISDIPQFCDDISGGEKRGVVTSLYSLKDIAEHLTVNYPVYRWKRTRWMTRSPLLAYNTYVTLSIPTG